MRGKSANRIGPAALLALGLACALPALAQTPQSAREVEKIERERELEILKGNLERAKAANEKLKAEVDALKNDRAELSQTLVATARRIRDIETKLSAAERRLAPLDKRETDLRTTLDARKETLAEVLGALTRMGRKPPPALLMHPEDALASVRSAILLGAVLPELRVEAETLSVELGELARLRGEIATERQTLDTARRTLDLEQVRLTALVAERQRALTAREQALAAERNRLQALNRQTETVRDLIAQMEREIAAAAKTAATRNPAIDPSLALLDPARQQPGLPFAKAKGKLPLPVSGSILRDERAENDPDRRRPGISIETRAGTQVIAPADGWVAFAGPFRAFGNLLILNTGDGYHVLLAGMESFTVELGQFVRMGEPVAVMGLRPDPAPNNGAATRKSILYVEFRKDGNAIDSGPWWAKTGKQKARG